MKKLLFIAIAFTGLTLVSCNKDQAAVKKLDGTWSATSATQEDGGVSFDFLGFVDDLSMTFNACKLKSDEWCTGSTSTTFAGVTSTDNVVYRVTGDGTVLETKVHTDSSTINTLTITELSKNDATFTQVDGTTTTTFVMAKQ